MRSVAIVAAALALAGCVMANSQMLDGRTAVISARGSGFSSTADVAKKVMVEAATMAQTRGYEYFQIVGVQDATQSGVYRTQGTSNTYGSGMANCAGNACFGSYNSSTTYNPGQAYTIIRPGADVAVRFLHANEVSPEMRGTWNAASVLAQQK